jgi:hypothetical protein
VTGNGAEISLVLVTPAGFEPVRRTISHLRRQTARDRIELVIVAQSALSRDELGHELDGFAAVRLLDLGPFPSMGAAFAAGVRAASAPIVGCAEEHSFPEPGWAAALIQAHSGSWAAVSGVIENANPGTFTSWAALASDFGPAMAPLDAGEASELPGHHTSYKRSVLLGYGSDLEQMLEVEWVLQEDLRASGARLFREPAAVSRHLNPSRVASHLHAQMNGGRLFAGNRSRLRNWNVLRRLVWVAGSPLHPLVRLSRSLPHLRRADARGGARLFILLALGLLANSVGQMIGYALGPGQAGEQRLAIDLHRRSDLTESDRVALAATPLGELPLLT